MSHRLGHVEVVVHGLGEGVGGGPGARPDLLAAAAASETQHPVPELGQPAHRLISRPEWLLVPIEGAAVVGAGDEQVADRRGAIARLQQIRNGPEVAEPLGHLLLADGQVFAMAPDPDERLPGRRLGLGDLVLVVGEDVVDPAAVDVQALAEQGHAHRRALDVPAGAAAAQAGVPADVVRPHRLPEGEVAGVLLGVVVGIHPAAHPSHQSGGRDAGEPAVRRKAGDAEVDAALAAVCDPLRLQALDQGHHLLDVAGGPRVVVGPADAEGIDVGEEALDPRGGLRRQPLVVLGGVVDQPVVHVGQVHDVGDPREAALQPSAQDVLEEEGPEVPDVGTVPDRRAAGVEAHVAGLQGRDRLEPAGQGVVEAKTHGRSRISMRAGGRVDPLRWPP